MKSEQSRSTWETPKKHFAESQIILYNLDIVEILEEFRWTPKNFDVYQEILYNHDELLKTLEVFLGILKKLSSFKELCRIRSIFESF